MQDAYAEGTSMMNKSGQQATENIIPDHEIKLEIKLSANVEGHTYNVDSKIIFEIELEPIMQVSQAPTGNLSSLLDGLGIDMGDNKDAVMEQLGQPRALGRVKDIKTKELDISDSEGKVNLELNKQAKLFATLKDNKIHINCESIFTYPQNPDVFIAIPSMQMMQENIVLNIDNLGEKEVFSWTEKDKDNLKVQGSCIIKQL